MFKIIAACLMFIASVSFAYAQETITILYSGEMQGEIRPVFG